MSDILSRLQAQSDPEKAAQMVRYHKTTLPVLGVSNPMITDAVKAWRADRPMDAWLAEAGRLWDSGIFEARIAAPKLLVKARIPDPALEAAVWEQICAWGPEMDGWAIADHVADVAGRRLMVDLTRLDVLDGWRGADNLWMQRGALIFTLPLAKLTHPSADQQTARDRVLEWAADYVPDHRWFIQKAIGWWLRTLSPREPDTVRQFVATHGDRMRAVARREALRALPPDPRPAGTPSP